MTLTEPISFAAADSSGNQLLDYLNNKMMHGVLGIQQRALILGAITAIPATNSPLRAKTAIYLIAASAQYQVQR